MITIGPSFEHTLDLFALPFYHDKREWKSIFHAITRNNNGTIKESFQCFSDIVKTVLLPEHYVIQFGRLFGLYAFQHHREVGNALKQLPANEPVYIEGFRVDENGTNRVRDVEAMISFVHRVVL